MIVVSLFLALLIICITGLGLTLIVTSGQQQRSLAEVCALSWFFGTGVISLLLWLGGLLFSGPVLQGLVAVIALGLGAYGLLTAKNQKVKFTIPQPRNAVEWILIGIIAIQFLAMIYCSFSYGLGWDGLLNLEIKARYSFLNDGVMPAGYFSDNSRDFTHQSYPLWIPLTELWLYLCMGEAHQFWLKILFAPFYIGGTILLATVARRLTGQRWIGLLTVALLFFIPCLTTMPGGVQVGYVDVPISMLYLAAIGYLLLAAADKNAVAYWRIYALSLALLPWAKREGTILWLIAASCGLLVMWRTRRPVLSLLWLVPGPVIIVGWKAFYSAMGKSDAFEYLPMTFTTLAANYPRIGVIGQSLYDQMMNTTDWSIFWMIAAAAFALLLCRTRDYRLLILFMAAAGPITVYGSLYIFSGWPDWVAHIEQSFSRLLLHVMPVIWLAIALALQPPRRTES